jgi:cholesterol transport system auxiliary component
MLLTATLGACAALLPQTPNTIFDLSAPRDVPGGRANVQLLIPEPTALKSLDTDRIAARPTPAQYAYLPGAAWSDRLPRLLQARLMETYQNSGKVRAAALPGQGVLIDYQVIVEIRAFEYTDEGASAEFAVKLMDDRGGRVVATRTLRRVVPVASTDNGAIVAGLDTAMDEAFLDIVDWTLQRI